MRTLAGRDFLSINDIDANELRLLLRLAKKFKRIKKFPKLLQDKQIALIFQKPSTRTRVSLEVAIDLLGGNAIALGWDELQLGRGESIEDTARALEKYVDCIVARVFSHGDLMKMAEVAKIPVVNALSDLEHPLQTLADLLTIDEFIGFRNVEKIAYVGDGNNVCHSLMLGCNLLGLPLVVASPKRYEPKEEIVKRVDPSLIKIVNSPIEAVRGADVVMTDTWVSMGMEREAEERIKAFLPFQVNKELVSHAKKNFIFMHCLPAYRGREVTGEVIDSKNSVVWQQAHNRLFTQAALLSLLL